MTKNIFSIMHKTTMAILILGLLINSSLIIFDVACVKADTSIKIMPLGDSITYGTYYESNGGYRQKLYADLTNAGFNIDFVGSQNSGVSFDNDHEGHIGWFASQIRSSINVFLTSYSPDIVLLHIGTNDIEAGIENVAEIEGILDNIDTYENSLSRNITVVLARIILRNDTSVLDDNTKAFNNAVAAMVSTRIASGDNIIIVDMENALTYPDDLTDNVHPNMVGYEKMAAVWYNAVYNELVTKMLIADFTASPRSGTAPLTVTFSDASSSDEGIISWSWDFGDGTTSTVQNPTHNFHVGTYTVSLTVGESDGDNDTETKTAYIIVARPANKVPIADAGGPYNGIEGITISFDGSNSSDSDGTIVSYLWDFGDGQTSTDQNPTHIYVQNGTYPVALTVTDDDSATDTGITSAVIADVKPLASFIALPTSGTRPLTVNFTDTSISYDGVVSWVWNFGDGQTSSDQNPSHIYSEGKYHVSLMVVEADGDSGTITKNNYIIAQPPPNSLPVANFGIQSSANPAINEEISFIDQSIDTDGTVTSWLWNFGDGNTTITRNPIHKFQSMGTYTITLTVKDDDGATDTITKQLTIHEI
ncbi:PKD domain-containing protein, partial [Candidatus Dojkabacteria bacterium]|nr:PKD domain-containing protein [Candidatus Dojkabacteria bacterium]